MVDRFVKLGEMKVGLPGKFGTKGDTLLVRGLGSCVAVIIYDPFSKISVMSHVALPEKIDAPKNTINKKLYSMSGKYANTFIKESLVKIKGNGGRILDLKAKLSGGAKMFDMDNMDSINLGVRNVNAVKEALEDAKIEIVGEDVLGDSGRTVWFDVDSLTLRVKNVKLGYIREL
ncbi:MAG: chemotaxis protein CheD [Candidatus Heimdallarchaeota archaeon]|nr:chemotaxis protein CheD [Candidatus Heimdallarchaeota archaeon]